MYSKYNLKINSDFFNNYSMLITAGKYQLKSNKDYVRRQLCDYLYNDDTVNGSLLMEDWFQEVAADIFISHSHKDEDLANALAGWLSETFGLKSFIDSNIWGYSDDLLEVINNKYSNKHPNGKGGYLYDHSKCNLASQHVNIMLSTALHKMIDKTECIIFLNTENSINESVYDKKAQSVSKTYSPWIYTELLCTQIIRESISREICHSEFRSDEILFESASEFPKISYDISLEHLKKINAKHLVLWEYHYTKKRNGNNPLDALYKLEV